jgi:hypothetical protein
VVAVFKVITVIISIDNANISSMVEGCQDGSDLMVPSWRPISLNANVLHSGNSI